MEISGSPGIGRTLSSVQPPLPRSLASWSLRATVRYPSHLEGLAMGTLGGVCLSEAGSCFPWLG